MTKRARYFLLYGNIVQSLHCTRDDAERQKQYYIEQKVVRYPELLFVEKFDSDVIYND